MLQDRSPYRGGAPLKVLVAARREATRAALTRVLDQTPGIEPVGVAGDLSTMISALRRLAPDVVVIDRALFADAGEERLSTDAAPDPHAAFVVIGMGDHPGFAASARAAGAADYVRLDEAAERIGDAVAAAGSAVRAG